MKIILLLNALLVLYGCSGMRDSYKVIGEKLQKEHRLTRSDLIITYDLGKLDKANCIYAEDLGLIINNGKYPEQYIKKFSKNYKSPEGLKKEALNKVVRISAMLLKLHASYHILSDSKFHYIKKLSEMDFKKIDPKNELSKLNEIILFIPIMLPEYKSLVSSHYGKRFHPLKQQNKFHNGTDLVAANGSEIFAAASGKIVFAGKRNGYGLIVEIMHSNSIITKYAHLDSISVRLGQNISRGKMLGKQGRTGNAVGHHLHFEIWIKDRHVNPYDFIGFSCKCQGK